MHAERKREVLELVRRAPVAKRQSLAALGLPRSRQRRSYEGRHLRAGPTAPFIVLFLGIACLIAIFELVGIHEIHDSCYPDCH